MNNSEVQTRKPVRSLGGGGPVVLQTTKILVKGGGNSGGSSCGTVVRRGLL